MVSKLQKKKPQSVFFRRNKGKIYNFHRLILKVHLSSGFGKCQKANNMLNSNKFLRQKFIKKENKN